MRGIRLGVLVVFGVVITASVSAGGPDCNGNGVPDDRDEMVHRWVQRPEVKSADGALSDDFGTSVAITGDVAVVGAPEDNVNGNPPGSAYVFRRTPVGWVQEAKLIPSDAESHINFGHSVAVSGDTAVIGAIHDNDNGQFAGAAYVFRWSGTSWVQEAKLLADDGEDGDSFGFSVAISGDVVAVGAPLNDSFRGAAYVFRRTGTTWVQEAKLLADGGTYFDLFGGSVSVWGDLAAIGSGGVGVSDFGSVQVFRAASGTWTLEASLTPDAGASDDHFGAPAVVFGDTVLVGSPFDDDNGQSSGSAYVFRKTAKGWVEEIKLLPDDGASSGVFGGSVSLFGDVAVIGASGHDDNGLSSGLAYVFRRSGTDWVQEQKLSANIAAPGDAFGAAVSVSDGMTVIGAPGNQLFCDDSVEPGGLYVFESLDSDCNGNGVLDQCDIDGGFSQDCNGNTVPDDCEPECNGNGVPDGCDISKGDSQDCNANENPDECDIADGSSQDCDQNGVPDECEPDCNTNGSPDACDIADGLSEDCDGNGVPDSCDPDCNGNGSPDACDIAAGISEDCNSNNAPDECDVDGGELLAKVSGACRVGGSAQFGRAVAISGNVAMIGAWNDDTSGLNSGAVYVFRETQAGWVFEDVLQPDDAGPYDRFGTSVMMSSGVAVIGAVGDDDLGFRAGAAYVFRNTGAGWEQEAKLLADDGEVDDLFGLKVGISGDAIIIGAVRNDDADPGDPNCNSGSAYIFRRSGKSWVQEAKILPKIDACDGSFGGCVAVSENVAVIAGGYGPGQGAQRGITYLFERGDAGWVEVGTLQPDDCGWPSHCDLQGCASVSDGLAAINVRLTDSNGVVSTPVYLFRGSGANWTQEAKLLPHDGGVGRGFGESLSISGDLVAVGASPNSASKVIEGAVYVFRRNGTEWAQLARLEANDGASGDQFGESVSISGASAVIGARSDADNGSHSGSAYVFNVVGSDCNGNGLPDDCDVIGEEDFDADGDVDLEDYSGFVGCLSAPDETPSICLNSCLSAFDADGDGDVDLLDFGALQRAFVGSGG